MSFSTEVHNTHCHVVCHLHAFTGKPSCSNVLVTCILVPMSHSCIFTPLSCCSHWPSDQQTLPTSLSQTRRGSHKPHSTASVETTTHSILILTLQLWEVGCGGGAEGGGSEWKTERQVLTCVGLVSGKERERVISKC